MKIYLSHKKPLEATYKHCSNLPSLENACLDGEVTDLVIDRFLSSFSYHEISELIKIILKKCRMNCQVTIMEIDCNLLFREYSRDDIELEYLNTMFFDSSKKCILNTETIIKVVPENFTVEEKSIQNTLSTIMLRRLR